MYAGNNRKPRDRERQPLPYFRALMEPNYLPYAASRAIEQQGLALQSLVLASSGDAGARFLPLLGLTAKPSIRMALPTLTSRNWQMRSWYFR